MLNLGNAKDAVRRYSDKLAGRSQEEREVALSRPGLTHTRTQEILQALEQLQSSRMTDPLVSVVVAAYNVSGYLRVAVESVLNSTLRHCEVIVVDDHSTDGTLEVAYELAQEDHRVRVLRTPENSGGPGVPRNIGIREARAQWVTFLDGDDELETHALKNLWEGTHYADVDLVVGKTQRVSVATGKRRNWYGRLFEEERRGIRIDELPELLDDSIAAGKLFRRSFTMNANNWLLEGVHYEDLVFTARVYAEARAITVIPATTYYWNVYPVEERRSITAQSNDLQNLEHRLNALKLVDEALLKAGNERLLVHLRRKFLRHDARIYLNQAPIASDEWLEAVIDAIEPRLRSFTDTDWSYIDEYARFVYGSVLSRNLEGLRQAVLFNKLGGTLAGRTITVGERVLWQPTGTTSTIPHSDSLEFKLLDITDSQLLSAPAMAFKPRSVVSVVSAKGEKLTFKGETDNFHGKFSNGQLVLQVKLRKQPHRYFIPVVHESNADTGTVQWTATWVLPSDMPNMRPQIWDFKLFIDNLGQRFESELVYEITQQVPRVDIKTIEGRFFCRSFTFYKTENGHLAMKLGGAKGQLKQLDRVAGGIRNYQNRFQPVVQKAMSKRSWNYNHMRKLPIDHDAVFCESMLGKSQWDSPRYVAEAVLQLNPNLKIYWTYSAAVAPELPAGFIPVKRWSREYFLRAATAQYIVDNQTLPPFFKKREEQIYVQTWHGIPLKTMGLDEPQLKFATQGERQQLIDRAAQWNALVSPNKYFEDTFVASYRYRGDLIRHGTPRNDVLVSEKSARSKAKHRLGLPADKIVILYAPTFRKKTSADVKTPREAMDLESWIEKLGDSVYLLVRAHYLDKMHIPKNRHQYALDVSLYPNVNDLYLAADVLVTDYSSAMFDFATLDRPIGFFAYDLDQYVNSERGTYFDVQAELPGPIFADFGELIAGIPDLIQFDAQSDAKYQSFKEKYCGVEDGNAAMRTAQYLLERGK